MYWTGGRLQMLPHCQKLPTDAQEQRERVGGSLKVVNAFLEYCLKKTASHMHVAPRIVWSTLWDG